MTDDRLKRFPLVLADLVKPDSVDSKGRPLRPVAGPPARAAAQLAATALARAALAKPSKSGTPPQPEAAAKPTPLIPAALRPALRPGQHRAVATPRAGTSAQAKTHHAKQPVKAGSAKVVAAKGPSVPAVGKVAAKLPAARVPAALPAKAGVKPDATRAGVSRAAERGVRTGAAEAAFHAPAAKPAHTAGIKFAAVPQTPTVKPLSRHHRGTQRAPEPAPQTHHVLNSDRVRERMVERLQAGGIRDARVLTAMAAIPRHLFVDAGLATQAYEDAALPIGHHQTISKPSVVARMIELAAAGRALSKVLEIGTGCGYQAAVLSQVAREVYSIERIRPLSERAKLNLRSLRLPNLRLHYGDGRLGLPEVAPFDAILLAAAGLEVPQALLEQLAIGGRLIAPVGGAEQVLTLIERVAPAEWRESRLDRVFFVPLKTGVV